MDGVPGQQGLWRSAGPGRRFLGDGEQSERERERRQCLRRGHNGKGLTSEAITATVRASLSTGSPRIVPPVTCLRQSLHGPIELGHSGKVSVTKVPKAKVAVAHGGSTA